MLLIADYLLFQKEELMILVLICPCDISDIENYSDQALWSLFQLAHSISELPHLCEEKYLKESADTHSGDYPGQGSHLCS